MCVLQKEEAQETLIRHDMDFDSALSGFTCFLIDLVFVSLLDLVLFSNRCLT